MEKSRKDSIMENVELLKQVLKLSNDDFEKCFGICKETGCENILNAILSDLEKC